MKNSKNDLFDAFNKAYNNLNPEQRLAVDTIEGPVMVIAGPGTGKTQILTLRIANILLKTDTRPENILALTFTDSGVRAMRNRLTSFIGADAYNVPIHTFHSFAGDLIRKYPDAYENIVGGRPASELEKRKIIEDLLEDEKYKRIRPHGDPSFYVKPILDAISTLKKEYISSEKLSQSIEIQIQNLDEVEKFHTKGAHKGKVRGEYQDLEKMLERNQELLHIYQRYNAKMRALRLFDFEDMILDTISSLEKNQDMLFDTQEQYQYILADEHQDVNQSQNRLIEIISNYHESPNVFVVGDEKQAIFRFQGASLENFLFFEDIYKSAKIIALTSNYRSDQKILDLAHESISTDDPELKKLRIPLKAEKQYEVILSKQSFSHRAIEDSWVVDQIKKHHTSGVSYKEMAIIVHTNKEIQQLATLLRKEKIPVSPSSDNDILEHPIFITIKNLMRAVAEVDNEVILAEVLQAPYWNINNNDLVLVLMSRSFSNRLSKIISNESSLKDIGVENVESFLRVDRVLQSARADSVTKTPAEVLEKLLQESGLLDFALQQTIYDSTRVVRRLYDEVESMFYKKEALDLKSVLEQLSLCEKYGIPLSAPFIETTKEAVALMTAHKAKGLEFEVVIIPHLTDNIWGGNRSKSSLFQLPITKHVINTKEQIEDDERRLFYVAITRAKRVLECSYSVMNTEGKDLTPSRFLVELSGDKIFENDTSDYENKFVPTDNLKTVITPNLNTDFLRIALALHGWSATSFNNYHKSPWDYIYKNVLRIPTIKTPELQFGSAVHAVLEKVVPTLGLGGEVSPSEIKKQLDLVLGKYPLSVMEFTRAHERAFEAILAYLPTLKNTLAKINKTEYKLHAVLETDIAEFPEVILKGNFDRIDFDEYGKVIRVVDYKTGKPKTRGVIEGKTKDSDGNYKRQLVFYALLLSLNKDSNFHCRTGLLSFVEPDQKGVVHEEQFDITEEEIVDLKKQIIEATKTVFSGECLNSVCDSEKSSYCHLVEVLKS